MEDVIEGKLDYTIADSVAISLFQRVHPELAVALDITDEQPVTWFSPLDGDNTLSAALLDFFNEMNEDGTLARIEEKYPGHGDDFDYVDTRTFFTRRRCGTAAVKAPCLRNTPKKLTGVCWPLLLIRNRTGMHRPLHRRVCAA